MKVYYIGSGLDGCYYVRCLIPLVNAGWNGELLSLLDEKKSPQRQYQEVMQADIVVFHRPDTKEKLELAKILKSLGKKIVFDNDDTFKHIEDLTFNSFLQGKQKIIEEFIELSDLVTCTTRKLKEEYLEHNENVAILKNLVDPSDWEEPKRNEGEKIRIGLIGSVALNGDYEDVKDILKKIDEDNRFQLVLFALPPKKEEFKITRMVHKKEINFWESLKNIEWQPYVLMEDYFDTLNDLKLDIAIIPRKDNYFNECKSNLKFLEMSMLEVPVITNGKTYLEDRDYLLFVDKKDDWLKHLETLADKKTRRDLGKKAKEYVLKEYNANTSNQWEEEYKKLLN
jgi:hypothetical protein